MGKCNVKVGRGLNQRPPACKLGVLLTTSLTHMSVYLKKRLQDGCHCLLRPLGAVRSTNIYRPCVELTAAIMSFKLKNVQINTVDDMTCILTVLSCDKWLFPSAQCEYWHNGTYGLRFVLLQEGNWLSSTPFPAIDGSASFSVTWERYW